MIPVVALVGRPNVGKSTLFNRLTRSRDALVANFSGLTRDRQYGEVVHTDPQSFIERKLILIDTGGLSGEEDGIDTVMAEQSLLAIEEADLVLFMVDCRDGLMAADQHIAKNLRQRSKATLVVANKIDGLNHDVAVSPFYELGLGEVVGVAAAHGRGVRSLLDDVLTVIPAEEPVLANENVDENLTDQDADGSLPVEIHEAKGVKIAVVGRPNVGKSTLVNRMLGEDRVVVFDEPGTTRDSIYINYERQDKPYTLIDTAGVRRRKNITLAIEKFSIVKTIQAIADANVVILVTDAKEGIVDQDLSLMSMVINAGRALVVALNKWDGLEDDHKTYVKVELERRLRFIDFADTHFISALHGTGVGHLYKSIERAYKAATEKLSTNFLTRILEQAVKDHAPPMINGRRIKLRYAHPGGSNPPVIVIHGNQVDQVTGHYKRYLEKTFRKALDLHGTPVKIEFRTSENPFAGRKSKLTQKGAQKKRRLEENAKNRKKK